MERGLFADYAIRTITLPYNKYSERINGIAHNRPIWFANRNLLDAGEKITIPVTKNNLLNAATTCRCCGVSCSSRIAIAPCASTDENADYNAVE